jgi:ribosomal protein L37AE/L43A
MKFCPNCLRVTRHIRVNASTMRCEVCGRNSVG